jgi:uncharacterized protein with NAD-binding domain and iron-sulfur cluster
MSHKTKRQDELSKGDLVKAEEFQPDDKVFIKGETISKRFKEYIVGTTHKEIMESLDKEWTETKRELVGMTIVCYKNIVQYSDEELNNMYVQKNQKWTNWCNDVVLFHIYRKKIDPNYLIPIVDLQKTAEAKSINHHH